MQLIYLADLVSPDISAGPESAEVGLFEWDDIPWNEIAFPSVHWALNHYAEVCNEDIFHARTNPPGELGDFE